MKHKVISLLFNEHWEKLENSFYTYMGIITPERLSRTWFLKLSLEKSEEIFLILANKGIIDDRSRVNIAILQRDFNSLHLAEISSQKKTDIYSFLQAGYLDSVKLGNQDFDRLMHIYSNYNKAEIDTLINISKQSVNLENTIELQQGYHLKILAMTIIAKVLEKNRDIDTMKILKMIEDWVSSLDEAYVVCFSATIKHFIFKMMDLFPEISGELEELEQKRKEIGIRNRE